MSNQNATVVQVIPHAKLGGMQEVAYALDRGLPAEGVCSTITNLEAGRRGFPGRTGLLRYWNSLRAQWRRERPDAVMAHTTLNALFSLTAARAAGVPRRIAVVHNSRVMMGEPKTLVLAVLAMTGVCTDVVHCGMASADSYSGLPGRVRRVSTVIQNGIRLPQAGEPQPATSAAGVPEVIVAGRLIPVKRVDVAIDAVMRMDRDVQLHVFGDGEERARLEAQAAAGPRPDRVVFHGPVGRDELNARYHTSQALLFPSQGEGLPLVLIEAAAAGIPVVASPLPCNVEVMGDAAAYAAVGDAGDWARVVSTVLEDTNLREQMVQTGVSRVGHFSAERMVKDYAHLLLRRS